MILSPLVRGSYPVIKRNSSPCCASIQNIPRYLRALTSRKLSTFSIEANLKPNFCRYIQTLPQRTAMASSGLALNYVVTKLNSFAPQRLAESWDNVGLLIEPATPKPITLILLTNDLTEAVMKEAVDLSANMIISYHPPIFAPLKSLTSKTWKERIVAKCLENRIALYSPHTSFDAVKGGVNDWLASAFDTEWVKPIIQTYQPGGFLVEITIPNTGDAKTALTIFQSQLEELSQRSGGDAVIPCKIINTPEGDTLIQIVCSKSHLHKLEECYKQVAVSKGYQLKTSKYEESPVTDHGMGRLCQLKTPVELNQIVDCIKKHLDMPHLRLAVAVDKDMGSKVSTVALCAGSGASVLKKANADLFLTGEMLHHDILDAVHNGSHVVLTNHSDSERGYLVNFAQILSGQLLDGKVKVVVAKKDCDPLKTV